MRVLDCVVDLRLRAVLFAGGRRGVSAWQHAYQAHRGTDGVLASFGSIFSSGKQFHVVLLDDGRAELAAHPVLRQTLTCLRCGGCLYECPVFAVTAGHFGDKYFAGCGAAWAATVSRDPEKAAAIAHTCLSCGRCTVRCPMGIDTPEMMIAVKRLAEGKS